MPAKQTFREHELAAVAKRFRVQSKLSKSEIARRLGVTKGAIHQAEELPEVSLTKVRVRMIELLAPFRVVGPVFLLERK